MSNRLALAINGGTPVRDTSKKPWTPWPQNDEEEWKSEVEPMLKSVYLSRVEGLSAPRSKEFGEMFANYCGSKFAMLMPHGTDAISAALAGALDLDGLGDGGEVIVPNYTFIATASAALERRCGVAFVDIDIDNFTISPSAIEAAVDSQRSRAIIAVHLGGHAANMDEILKIAQKHNLSVIEDCAQAHGAEYNGKKVGSIGDAGAYSFQSSKNLTSGEGGAVTTNDQDLRDRVYSFMNVGRRPEGARWEYPRIGWNYRPSEYLAALLIVRLKKLEEQTDIRNANAAYLSQELKQIEGLTPPILFPWVSKHGYHLYMMKYNPEGFGGHSRDEFVQALSREGVPCSKGYGGLLSKEGGVVYVKERYPQLIRELPCPNVEKVCQESVWLYQNMLLTSKSDMDDIIEAIAKIQKAFRMSV